MRLQEFKQRMGIEENPIKKELEKLRDSYKNDLTVIDKLIELVLQEPEGSQNKTTSFNYYTGKQKVTLDIICKLDRIL